MKESTIHLGDIGRTGSTDAPEPSHEYRGKRKSMAGRIMLLVIGLAVIGYLFSLVSGYFSWRAIFLTNNQVYFGHFWDLPFSSAITLHNVYYLEVAQPNQQLTDPSQSQQLKLVRLGNEIHAPTDNMTIPMGQVLFWETLRSDSAVVAAIKNLSH